MANSQAGEGRICTAGLVRRVVVGTCTALALVLGLGARRAAAQCCGDCNGDGAVTIDELVTAVNRDLSGCQDDGICTPLVASCNDNLTACNTNLSACLGSVTTCTAGTAAAEDVLSGKTFASSSGIQVTGTMPSNGAVTLTPGTGKQTIAAGYHNGAGYCAGDANLVADNIKRGTSIFGVAGNVLQATGNAAAGDVLLGTTFSNAGGAGTGTMPNNGALTLTPGTTNQPIPAGYHDGSGKCAGDAALVAGNIKSGVTIFGVTGTVGCLLATGQTTAWGPGSDGDVRAGAALAYTDNGDGTIADHNTGLVWEKKDDSGGIHGKDNTYTWGMVDPPYTMNGTMVTEFLATLNTPPCFAGHCDWRIPNVRELLSIVDYEIPYPDLTVNAAFHNAAGCTGCTDVTLASCSCTASRGGYWSSTTSRNSPFSAWGVYFNGGFVDSIDAKSLNAAVRAVRGGL